MFAALDHVHNAVDLLVGQTVSLDERFCEAAVEFVAAVNGCDDWPTDLKEKARGIQQRLTEGGSVEATIGEMDPSTAEQIADDILDFAEALTTFRIDLMEPKPDSCMVACAGRPAREGAGLAQRNACTSVAVGGDLAAAAFDQLSLVDRTQCL